MATNHHTSHPEYHHQPTQPIVLKVENQTPPCVGHDAFSHAIIADTQGKESYMMPTRMNVMRFIQDFCKAYGCNGVGENWEPSEELILAEFDKFFKYNKS